MHIHKICVILERPLTLEFQITQYDTPVTRKTFETPGSKVKSKLDILNLWADMQVSLFSFKQQINQSLVSRYMFVEANNDTNKGFPSAS